MDGETIVLWDGSNAGEIFKAKHGILASTMTRVRPGTDYDAEYFYYALKGWEEYLKGQTSGSGIPHVDKEVLEKLTILACDKREQSSIAAILSTIDSAIERTEALIAKQQRIKAGLAGDLLTHGVDEQGRVRSRTTQEFRQSPMGMIPVSWRCEPLAVFVPSAEYGISSSLGDSGQPVLRMNNLSNGEADLTDLKFTAAPVPDRLWLRAGDVLFNRTNSWEHVGRTGIWRGQHERTTFASYLVRLNPDRSILSPELLNIWLNWPRTQIAMRRFATPGVQQVNINPTNLRALSAAFPNSLEEQEVIVERVRALDHVSATNRDTLAKLRALKRGLQQDLLTGRRRVTPLLEADRAQEQVA